jgi:membrane-bound inhibitor of C-type lysozyme
MKALVLASAMLAALASPALADTGVNLGLTLAGDAEVKTVAYTCEGHDPITVQYINAAPNFLAVLPIEGRQTVFVSVLTGSGAKYVSGQYEWWNKGTDVTLHDVTEGLDAAPVLMCSEDIQTP